MTIRELYKQILGICREYNARLPESDCSVTPKRLVAQLTFTDDGEIKETMIPINAPLEEAEFLQLKLSAFGKIRKHMKIFAGSDEKRIIANLKKFDELAHIELQRTIKNESGGMI